jgi:hypothetical protein
MNQLDAFPDLKSIRPSMDMHSIKVRIMEAVREELASSDPKISWSDDDFEEEDESYGPVYRHLWDVVKHSQDGYVAAREMEYLGYQPDAQMVQVLDELPRIGENILYQATIEWAATQTTPSPFAIGDRVWTKRTSYGYITRIYDDQRTYGISDEPTSNRFRTVPWEDTYRDNPHPIQTEDAHQSTSV